MTTIARARIASPTAPISRVRRLGSVVAMLVAPWGFVVANTAYAWTIRNGGSDSTGAEALALAGAYPMPLRVGLLAGMCGCLLLVPAILGVFRVAPTNWLVLVGGSAMIIGYICYFGVLIGNFSVLAMAELGGPVGDFAAVIDTGRSDPGITWVFFAFVFGNLVGTLLFSIGLLVSRAVPTWAAAGIALWPVLHITGLVFFHNEIPQVVGAVLQAVGFVGCAFALLRRGSD